MQETQKTWVLSLGWESPLEKEMATHFSILAWEILWTEEPGGLQSMGLQTVGHDLSTNQQQSQMLPRHYLAAYVLSILKILSVLGYLYLFLP